MTNWQDVKSYKRNGVAGLVKIINGLCYSKDFLFLFYWTEEVQRTSRDAYFSLAEIKILTDSGMQIFFP
jgi:hypothetical protein